MSEMFKLSSNDLVRSITTTVFAAVIGVLYGLTQQGDFNVFTADWGAIGSMVVNAIVVTFVARISEKSLTAENGKVFGKIG